MCVNRVDEKNKKIIMTYSLLQRWEYGPFLQIEEYMSKVALYRALK